MRGFLPQDSYLFFLWCLLQHRNYSDFTCHLYGGCFFSTFDRASKEVRNAREPDLQVASPPQPLPLSAPMHQS
jgi:hypothetical protein